MSCQNLGRLRVEVDNFVYPNVYFGKIALIERRLQQLAIFNNALILQLFLRTKHVPCGIQLLVLRADCLALGVAFCLKT